MLWQETHVAISVIAQKESKHVTGNVTYVVSEICKHNDSYLVLQVCHDNIITLHPIMAVIKCICQTMCVASQCAPTTIVAIKLTQNYKH